jgi:hypothetical protein
MYKRPAQQSGRNFPKSVNLVSREGPRDSAASVAERIGPMATHVANIGTSIAIMSAWAYQVVPVPLSLACFLALPAAAVRALTTAGPGHDYRRHDGTDASTN